MQQLATIDWFSNFFGYLHVFQVVEHIRDSFRTITLKNEKIFYFWLIFANFSRKLKSRFYKSW
jgi:hypothetical protein